MAAYVIAQIEVTNWEKFKAYTQETPATIAKHGGRFLARGAEINVLEGNYPDKRVVLIEFPSMQKAQEWYHSDEYQRVKALRQDAATGVLIAVDGLFNHSMPVEVTH